MSRQHPENKKSKHEVKNECVQRVGKLAHKHTRCSNKQSTAKGQYQSTLIKQNAHRETLIKQESRKILTKRKKMGLEMNTARTSSPNAANEKKRKLRKYILQVVLCACCSCYNKCRCSEEDVYFPILHWAEEIKQNSAFVLIE